jgi:hypothetical protein
MAEHISVSELLKLVSPFKGDKKEVQAFISNVDRLLRWRIRLEEYDYEIVFKKGVSNTNTDALSRVNRLGAVTKVAEDKQQRVTDEETKSIIVYKYHDSPVGGHRGMNRTFRETKKKYDWHNMKREADYVRKGKSCQMNQTLGPRSRAPMEVTTTARKPFEKCTLDKLGPTTETNQGNRYNLTTHRAPGYTPFELLFGYRARVPSSLQEPPPPKYTYEDVSELKGKLQAAHAVARGRLVENKTRSKQDYDRKTVQIALNVGDRVSLFDESVRRGRSKKRCAKWIGPYLVLAIDGVNATIKRGKTAVKFHVNRLKPFY